MLGCELCATLVVREDARRIGSRRVGVQVDEGHGPGWRRRCSSFLDLEAGEDDPVNLLVEKKFDVLTLLRDASVAVAEKDAEAVAACDIGDAVNHRRRERALLVVRDHAECVGAPYLETSGD